VDRSLEQYQECFKILETYILVLKDVFMQRFGNQVVQLLENVVDNIRDEAMHLVMQVVQAMQQLFPTESPQV
jgi:hypothetical protein